MTAPPKASGGLPRWLVIVAAILFFPITVVILIVRSKWSVRTKAIASGVWIVVLIAAGISGGASSTSRPLVSTSGRPAATSPGARAATPSPVAKASPVASAAATHDYHALTADNIKKSISDNTTDSQQGDFNNLTVTISGTQATVKYHVGSLQQKDTDMGSLVGFASLDAITVFRATLSGWYPTLTSVAIEADADFTTTSGNGVVNTAFRYGMSPTIAKGINWTGLEGLELSDNDALYCGSNLDSWYVAANIFDGLSSSDKDCLVAPAVGP